MRYVLSNSYNPYFNLAAEEYLLKSSSDNIFMLWLSEPSVIVGKHQNALAEINYKYLLDNNLKLARRLSGGGTVVHDMQNLNFTFITNGEEGKLIDFKKFIAPITGYLFTLGIEATRGEKNDIRIGDLKISGNAEHIYKKRVLHHGTLLFNSDLDQLKNAIRVVPGKYIDKAVQSNRAHVVNISDFLKMKMSIGEFIQGLSDFVTTYTENARKENLNEKEISEIDKLVKEKYSTIDWIYGYSPKYEFRNSFIFNSENWEVKLNIEKGHIRNASVLINNHTLNSLDKNIIGMRHNNTDIYKVLKSEFPNLNASTLNTLVFYFF